MPYSEEDQLSQQLHTKTTQHCALAVRLYECNSCHRRSLTSNPYPSILLGSIVSLRSGPGFRHETVTGYNSGSQPNNSCCCYNKKYILWPNGDFHSIGFRYRQDRGLGKSG